MAATTHREYLALVRDGNLSALVEATVAHPSFAYERCKERYNGTALIQASVYGQEDMVVWLLANGATTTIDIQDNGQRVALQYACNRNQENIAKLLLTAMARTDLLDKVKN